MFRKLGAMFLALCLLVGTLPLTAAAAPSGETYGPVQTEPAGEAGYLMYRVVRPASGDPFVELCREDGDFGIMDVQGDLEVPSTLGGYPVKRLGWGAFMSCTRLTSVKLPDTLVEIGGGAFLGCKGLTSLTIPKSVTTVGSTPFREVTCVIQAEEGNPNFVTKDSLFCQVLEDGNSLRLLHCPSDTVLPVLDIPEGVVEISGRASPEESRYTEIRIPSTLKFLNAENSGDTAFEHISANKYVVDPQSETFSSSEDGILYNKDQTVLYKYPRNRKNVTVDGKVTALGNGAFFDCELISADLENSKVTKLPFAAFSNCWFMTSIKFPAGLTEMGNNAMANCTALITLAFPEGFTALASGALANCSSLERVEIPASLTAGAEGAFSGGNRKTVIVVDEANPVYQSDLDGKVLYQKDGTGKAVVLLNVSDGVTNLQLPDTVTKIGDFACMYNKDLKSIEVSASSRLTEIGYKAFVKCLGLETLNLPAGVSKIDETAFLGEDAKRNTFTVHVSEGNNTFFSSEEGSLYTKSGTLLYAADVGTLTVDARATAIGLCAAEFSENLTNVVLPPSVKTIGERAFSACSKLTAINFPEGLTRISRYAFANSGLKEINLPSSVEYLGTFVFENCNALERVGGVEQGGQPVSQLYSAALLSGTGEKVLSAQAFSHCAVLEAAEIPSGITKIEPNAFEDCPQLRKVTVPKSVKEIGAGALPAGQGITIQGVKGSFAERFAAENGFLFNDSLPDLDPDPAPPPSGGGAPSEEEPGPDDEEVSEEIAALREKFTDVSGHWGEASLAWAYQRGLFRGVTESTFAPNNRMERGMFAAVLHRYAGEPAPQQPGHFNDVKAGAYYSSASDWAAEAGVILGVGNGLFDPASNVSREELACMLYRYAKPEKSASGAELLSKFSDADQVHEWAEEALCWAVEVGVISGRGNGILAPQGTATRAEVATMLRRFAALEK